MGRPPGGPEASGRGGADPEPTGGEAIMNRRDSGPRVASSVRGWPLALLAAAALAAGCTSPQVRSQCADEADHETKYDVQTVGDVSQFGNAGPVPVGGVGLVVGLDGTGGNPLPGGYTAMLEEQLQKRNPRELNALLRQYGARTVKELLASPDTSVVIVSGLVPAGSHKNDPIDVEVTLPPGSKTTSLRGGTLQACMLYSYDYARNLTDDPKFQQSNRAFLGNRLGWAEGPLLVGFGDGDEAAKERQGRIWGGGRCTLDRPFFIVMKDGHRFARVTQAVALRINETFRGRFAGPGAEEVAKAENNQVVLLRVPAQYRLNLPHYLLVVRMVPLREGKEAAADGKAAPDEGPHVPYRRRLEEDLLDPAHTVTAALRLEALGAGSVPALKTGLESPHPVVRFCSAQALAYLDNPAGGSELARAIEEHPVLRAYGLTALASMDQAISHVKLRELLASANPETRYGAFRALRALDERDPSLEGRLLGNSFWLHRVAPNSPPLVHLSTSRRAEVVLFGSDATLVAPFEFLAGSGTKFTLTAGDNDEHCTVTCFALESGSRRTRQCSLRLEDVLQTLADMGGGYAEAVEVLRQAGSCQCLSCPLGVDQLPQAISMQELARASAADPELRRLDGEVLAAKPDLGTTPTLYEKGDRREGPAEGAEDETVHARRPRGAVHTARDVE